MRKSIKLAIIELVAYVVIVGGVLGYLEITQRRCEARPCPSGMVASYAASVCFCAVKPGDAR